MDEKGEEIDEQMKIGDDLGRTVDGLLICEIECQRSCAWKSGKEDGFLKPKHASEAGNQHMFVILDQIKGSKYQFGL